MQTEALVPSEVMVQIHRESEKHPQCGMGTGFETLTEDKSWTPGSWHKASRVRGEFRSKAWEGGWASGQEEILQLMGKSRRSHLSTIDQIRGLQPKQLLGGDKSQGRRSPQKWLAFTASMVPATAPVRTWCLFYWSSSWGDSKRNHQEIPSRNPRAKTENNSHMTWKGRGGTLLWCSWRLRCERQIRQWGGSDCGLMDNQSVKQIHLPSWNSRMKIRQMCSSSRWGIY